MTRKTQPRGWGNAAWAVALAVGCVAGPCLSFTTVDAGDTLWVAVEVDSSRTYGAPKVAYFRPDSTGALWCRTTWRVAPGIYDYILHLQRQRFAVTDTMEISRDFPVMDSTGVVCVGASLRPLR